MDEKNLNKLKQMNDELNAVRTVLWDFAKDLAQIIEELEYGEDDLK